MERSAFALGTLEHGVFSIQTLVPLRGMGHAGGMVRQESQGRLRHVDGSDIRTASKGADLGCEKQAIWLSRRGMITKLLAAVDEDGLLGGFVLCAGNFHDLTAARLMHEFFRGMHWVGDKRFDCLASAKSLWLMGPLTARFRAKVSRLSMGSLNPLTLRAMLGAILSKTSSSE